MEYKKESGTMRYFFCLMLFAPTFLVPCSSAQESSAPESAAIEWAKIAAPAGWSRAPELETYTPATLYERINGESELYFPFGFRQLTVFYFVNDGNPAERIEIHVYEMGSVLDAFGIFSYQRSEKYEPAEVGTEGVIGMTMAMLYQDRYFLKVRYDHKREDKETLLAAARAAVSVIPGEKTRPAELAMLDLKHVDPSSVRYIAAHLGGYSSLGRGLEAEAQFGAQTAGVFISFAKDEAQVSQMCSQYRQLLAAEGIGADWRERNGGRVLLTPKSSPEGIALCKAGRFLIGITRINGDPETLVPILEQIAKRTEGVTISERAEEDTQEEKSATAPAGADSSY